MLHDGGMETKPSAQYDELGMSDREYDPVIVATEDANRIRAVLESPHVSPEFKAQVRTYAEGRRTDLAASGHREAAAQYDLAA